MDTSFFFSFTLLLLILNSFALTSCTTLFNSTTDQDSLLAFKNAITTSNPNNSIFIKNWSTKTSICNWTGVSCGIKHHRVSALNLSGFGIRGNLPPHLGNLTFLRSFEISSNNFIGLLPSELSKLRRLKEMNVGSNNFTGEIPSWLGALSHLNHISLNDNNFSGLIPLSLFNIPRLQSLKAENNLLDGEIPNQIRNFFPSLETLNLAGNRLSGSIPSEIFTNMSVLEEIDLRFNKLSGQLPNDTCLNTPKLRRIYLKENELSGKIPTSIQECKEMEELSLAMNEFDGEIPSEIGNLSMLTLISLYSNHLQGGVPKEIGYLKSLKFLYLDGNNLTGYIPKQIGNLTSLVEIDIASNKLAGELPEELGNLAYLEYLSAPFNDFLSGSIPSSIFNLSSLIILSLQQNQFSGVLPSTMGNSLPKLEELYLYFNKLSGQIPTSIANASNLSMLELNRNLFTGSIPNFSNLRFLEALRLWENNLTGAESPDQELTFLSSLTNCRDLRVLEISNNPFMNGILPPSIGSLSSVVTLSASNCSIRGAIPSEIGNMRSLQTLDLSMNQLTGYIPTTMGELEKLQRLHLYENQLQGYIPHHLCQISALGYLYLGGNMLTGVVPSCLGGVKRSLLKVSLSSNKLNSTLPYEFLNNRGLISLDLSSNNLSGELPSQVGSLTAVNFLDLSSNKFSGNLPTTIGNCKSLVTISLSNNMFNGSIPQSLGREVTGLSILDLSSNDLSGVIPESLQNLDLDYFNVSYNKLEGKIPDWGRFGNFTAQSFAHNFGLCGATRFEVPPCGKDQGRSRLALVMKYIVPPFIAVVICVVVVFFLIKRCKQKEMQVTADMSSVGTSWQIITERELTKGTSSFSEMNLLGKGSFGSVFKAILANETTVAVKVFNLELEGALKSFATESQILSTVRHRNLLRILGCCSNPEFKALILEYMPNGSLEEWLHSDSKALDMVQRLNIAIDVAVAVEYLHHNHTSTVVHCDIKPNNVLVDEEMIAHVGDFGISKLFEDREAVIHTMTMATVGYAAPEYGSEGKVSTKGDVYSYGILLLEIFTSKKPTDDMFNGEMGIREWVGKALKEEAISEVVATGLLSREDENFAEELDCVKSIFDLAMKCLAFSPQERINMMQAVAALQKFKVTVEGIKKRQSRSS